MGRRMSGIDEWSATVDFKDETNRKSFTQFLMEKYRPCKWQFEFAKQLDDSGCFESVPFGFASGRTFICQALDDYLSNGRVEIED